MKKTFAALLVLPFMVIAAHASAEETTAGAFGTSATEAQEKAEALVAKRVNDACTPKAKGGVAPGIAKSKCKVDKLSTGKYNAVCTQIFSCNKS
jgi:hypothetical protein